MGESRDAWGKTRVDWMREWLEALRRHEKTVTEPPHE